MKLIRHLPNLLSSLRLMWRSPALSQTLHTLAEASDRVAGAPSAPTSWDVVIASTSEDPAVRETTAFFVERDRPGFRIEGGYKTMAFGVFWCNIQSH